MSWFRRKDPPAPPPLKTWRYFEDGEVEWSKEYRDRLKNALPSKVSSSSVTKGRILLLGPIQSGKSSFINSIVSIDEGKINQVAPEGGGVSSKTRKLHEFVCGDFLISDTMGLEAGENAGFHKGDIKFLLDGNITHDYQFDHLNPITEETLKFKKNPTNADRVHCVIFCIGANEVHTEVQQGYLSKWQDLHSAISGLLVPRIIILTKIDRLCQDVKDDLSNTLKSEKVKEAVLKASEKFALSPMFIHPVKNFTDEMYPEHKHSILLLIALKQALEFAEGFIKRMDKDVKDTPVNE